MKRREYIAEYLRHRHAVATLKSLYELQATHLRLKGLYRAAVLAMRPKAEQPAERLAA